MRQAGLASVTRRRRYRSARAVRETAPAADLVDRVFVANRPGALWVADITYVPTAEGFLYLAVVLDVFSRKIAGWAMRSHLEVELFTAALDMALARCTTTAGLIHHSDRGSQYTSFAMGRRLREAGITPSMGSVGDAYDSALAESLRHARVRAARPDPLPLARGRQDRALRVARDLVQLPAPTLLAADAGTAGVRAEAARGCTHLVFDSPRERVNFSRVAIQPTDYVGPAQAAWFQSNVQAPTHTGHLPALQSGR